jgi:hypothetical protein
MIATRQISNGPGSRNAGSARSTDAGIDFTKRFIVEEFTPLFHTAEYSGLSTAARLRYNQFHALYFNEQVAFFEQEVLSPALRALTDCALPQELRASVERFHAEEQRHTARFRELNLKCAPEFYAAGPYYFVQIARPLRSLLRGMAAWPQMFPLLVWLALLQEERSLYYSKGCLASSADLEPHFVETHRAHLADEVGHIGWDEELLNWLWPRTGPWLRRWNARLLAWMVGEFFQLPKRSGLRVIAQLAREDPSVDLAALREGMRGLAKQPGYFETLYSREITPRSFARFDAEPEFALLERKLPGYRRPGSTP